MTVCLPQQCAVVCAAHGEGGGGAAVAEVKGVSPAPRAATSERERVEVQRFDVLAVLYELHEAQLVVFIHEVDDLVQQLFAIAASDGIAGVGAGGQTKILTSGEVSGILLKYPVQTILAGVAQWQRN